MNFRKQIFQILGSLLLLILLLAGCTTPGAQPEAGAARECPAETAGTKPLRNEQDGFCLLHPSEYTADVRSGEHTTILVVGSVLNHTDPRASIDVQDAGGRTATEVAEEMAARVAADLPEHRIERSTATIGGEQAVVLDKMPGQEINRQVLIVHDGRLYMLTFTHADEALGETYSQMENLYKTVVESFRFLPVE